MSRRTDSARGSRAAMILVLAVAVIASGSFSLEAQNSGVTGVVRSASGDPVAGALVKVRSEKLGLGFLVVSQAQGRYSTPSLLPGKYMVQGFGGTHQSAPAAPVEVGSGRPGKMDVVLSAPLRIPPREKRTTDDDYRKLIPEADNPFIKNSFAPICSECHSLEWVIAARKTPEQWQETLDRMQYKMLGYRRVLLLKHPEQVVEYEEMMKYFSKYFTPDKPQDPRVLQGRLLGPGGPSHPNRNLPATLLKGAAAKYGAMDFSLPPGSRPQDIAVDSQGIAWVTEKNTGMLGRFDPNSLAYTRIPSPPGKNSKSQLISVAVDPQDQVWFADEGPNARLLQYNPKSREFNTYPVPDYPWPVPEGWARVGTLRFSGGNVWAAGMVTDRIWKLDPGTRKISHYALPRGSVPFGLVINRDNVIWYTAPPSNAVVRLDPATGRVARYELPILRSDPKGMATDAEGNLWVAATESGKLLKVDRVGKFTEYAPPTEDSGPFAVAVDTERNLVWFSEVFADRIARFDPGANSFVEFPHPIADSDVQRIEIDRSHPNRVWWASGRGDKIGYLEVMEEEKREMAARPERNSANLP